MPHHLRAGNHALAVIRRSLQAPLAISRQLLALTALADKTTEQTLQAADRQALGLLLLGACGATLAALRALAKAAGAFTAAGTLGAFATRSLTGKQTVVALSTGTLPARRSTAITLAVTLTAALRLPLCRFTALLRTLAKAAGALAAFSTG